MVDFSNIAAQAVPADKTREYFFDVLVGEPSIITKAAHDTNPAFLDERLRLSTERAKKLAAEPRKPSSGEPTVEDYKREIDEGRDADCRLIAAVCATGWGTAPKDAKGKEVAFSEENCLAFLRALPIYVLDPFRAYVQNIYNFIDRPKLDSGESAALGESSPGS
jgi:hypothetical protein